MRTLIIVNNAAAKAKKAWPRIKEQLQKAGLTYQLHETKGPGDATDKTRSAVRGGIDTIAVVGGDGTFFELNDKDQVPQAINREARMALFPAGTGNDFARGLKANRSSLQSWIDTFVAYNQADAVDAQSIDVLYGRCDGYHKPFICLNASTMGIGGETAKRVASQGQFMQHFPGEFRFLYAALGALAVWRERRVRVTLDEKLMDDGPMNLVVVANGLYAGGGMMFSPEAQIDDGLLDVVTASGLSRAEVMLELTRVHRGGHVHNPKVKIVQGKKVKIETFLMKDEMPIEVNGNASGVTPAEFQVLPQALRLLV